MKVRHLREGYVAEIVGALSYDAHYGTMFSLVTDDGKFKNAYSSMLSPIAEKSIPDMSITVGHIIDNPLFETEFAFKIGTWDDEQSDWVALYDSRVMDDVIPADLLIEKVTFMTIEDGQLILEVQR